MHLQIYLEVVATEFGTLISCCFFADRISAGYVGGKATAADFRC